MLTTAAGFLLAADGDIDFRLLIATLFGTALIIAAACVINNYTDRGIDAKMERTKERALAAGQISAQSALTYALLMIALGTFIIFFYVNILTLLVGLFAFLNYITAYGWFKRHSVHGTLVGALSGAVPPVAGYVAVTNTLDLTAILLFLILILWQMPHFYSIAMYRYDDYKAAGLPVFPVVKGMTATKRQIIAYIIAFIIATTLLALGPAGWTYLIIILVAGIQWLRLGLRGFKSDDNKRWARRMFGFSLIVILALSVAMAIGSILP